MKNYLNEISDKLKSNLLVVVIGLLLYIFWYYCGLSNFFLTLPYLKISLGHIGYLGLLVIPAFLVFKSNFLQRLWVFFSTLILLDLINLVFITNGKYNLLPYNKSMGSTFLLMLIIVFFVAITMGLSSYNKTILQKGKSKLWYIITFSIITILFYHGSNIWLVSKGIINRDRSIFINNFEIHHINYGMLLLIIVPFLFKYIPKLAKNLQYLGYAFIGFIYGTVFDECYYYMNTYQTEDQFDKLYLNDIPILIISLIIMIFSFTIWFYFLHKEGKNV